MAGVLTSTLLQTICPPPRLHVLICADEQRPDLATGVPHLPHLEDWNCDAGAGGRQVHLGQCGRHYAGESCVAVVVVAGEQVALPGFHCEKPFLFCYLTTAKRKTSQAFIV